MTLTRRRAMATLIALMLVSLLGMAAVTLSYYTGRVSSRGLGGLFGGSPLQQRFESGKRVNVLLLGYGGAGHDGAYLTDSIMVVSLNPATQQMAYISIPRDTEVTLHPFADSRQSLTVKINAAFAAGMGVFGGPLKEAYRASDPRDSAIKVAAATVSDLTGLPIDYTVTIDFAGFRKAVDALGGVEVQVPQTFNADYPSSEGGGWETIHFDAGLQHLDPARALAFVRSRYVGCSETGAYGYAAGQQTCAGHPITDGDWQQSTDFARAQRQQLFLEAFRKRALQLNAVAKLGDLVSALSESLRTDMAVPADVVALWSAQDRFRKNGILHIGISDANLMYSCTCDYNGYTLHLFDDGSSLRRYLAGLFQAPALSERSKIAVSDATNDGGRLSRVWSSLLKAQGFDAYDAGAASGAGDTLRDLTGGRSPRTLAYLGGFFGLQPSSGPPASPGVIELVLGARAQSQFTAGAAAPSTPQPAPSPVPSPQPSLQPSPSPRPSPSRSPIIPLPSPSLLPI